MFKVEILRIIKTPINWVFSVLFPIAITIIFGILFGSEYLNYGLMGIILIVSLTSTIIPISIYFCSDKVEKRIKHYLIIRGAIQKYTISLYVANLIVFIFVSIIILIIGITVFNVEVNYKALSMLLTFPLISYTLAFMIAIILGSFITSINAIIPFSMLVFYLILFASGFVVPLQNLMEKNQGFYYIEVLTPFGCLYMFYSHVTGYIELSTLKLVIALSLTILWTISTVFLLMLSLKTFKR